MSKNPFSTGALREMTKAQLVRHVQSLRRRLAEFQAAEAERLQVLRALRESEEKYRLLLDESSDPIFTFQADGQYRYVNKAFADGVGRKQEEIIGRKIWDVFPKEEADKRYAAVKWVFENGDTKVIEVRVPRPEGDHYYITTVKPIIDDQHQVLSVICISKEITERKRMEQELQYLSSHDILTGLYNRNFFETELARLQRSRLFPMSILVADMDNLKLANDRYGHSAGDELIRKVAHALRRTFRAEDIVARLGGDEFAVLLPEMGATAAANAVARLRANLDKAEDPLLRVSIGLAAGGEGADLTKVIREADDAMYSDKAAHRAASANTPS